CINVRVKLRHRSSPVDRAAAGLCRTDARRYSAGARAASTRSAGGESMASGYGLVIRGGMGFDGTVAPGASAGGAVRGDRIAAAGAIAERGGTELDATGLAVSPGFIDVHSHDDFAVLLDPEMAFKVMQGVTTDIVGNCGSGVIPFDAAVKRFRRFAP